MIFGGVTADYSPTSQVTNLDAVTLKFVKKADMKFERVCSSGVSKTNDGYVYAMGGSLNPGLCERYNIQGNKWEVVPSYNSYGTKKDMTGWISCELI